MRKNDTRTSAIKGKSASSRPRRNVPIVDYTGMDTIEPECEFDGITNIWADETIYEDPDYIPDIKIKHKTTKTQTKTRPRRNVPVVDYTGMDTIEPECEFDGITDIWADETIYEDPDYIPN